MADATPTQSECAKFIGRQMIDHMSARDMCSLLSIVGGDADKVDFIGLRRWLGMAVIKAGKPRIRVRARVRADG